jgi:hypothetical protein
VIGDSVVVGNDNEMVIGADSGTNGIDVIYSGQDSATDLGSSGKKFKDLYLSGSATIEGDFNTGTNSMGGHCMAFTGARNGTDTAAQRVSYGNGGTNHHGPCHPYSGVILGLTYSASASGATNNIRLCLNGSTSAMANTAYSISSGTTSAVHMLTTPTAFSAGDKITGYFTAGNTSNTVITYFVRYD